MLSYYWVIEQKKLGSSEDDYEVVKSGEALQALSNYKKEDCELALVIDVYCEKGKAIKDRVFNYFNGSELDVPAYWSAPIPESYVRELQKVWL